MYLGKNTFSDFSLKISLSSKLYQDEKLANFRTMVALYCSCAKFSYGNDQIQNPNWAAGCEVWNWNLHWSSDNNSKYLESFGDENSIQNFEERNYIAETYRDICKFTKKKIYVQLIIYNITKDGIFQGIWIS